MGAFLLVLGSVINFVSFSFGSQAMLAGLVRRSALLTSRTSQLFTASEHICVSAT